MIKKLFNKIFGGINPIRDPDADELKTIIDFGDGFEARKLVDGKWVLWYKGTETGAIDFDSWEINKTIYFWPPDNLWWKDCKVSLQRIKLDVDEIKVKVLNPTPKKQPKIFVSELLE